MKINLTLLSILLLAFTQKFSSARFIVYVAHYTPPNLNTALPRCAGTIISPSHILSTASCVMVDAQTAVAVLVRTENEDYLVNKIARPTGIYTHPGFNSEQSRMYNVAILKINLELEEFTPKLLGELEYSTFCTLFGSGGSQIEPPRTRTAIFNPSYCDPNFPQVYCTDIQGALNSTCSALQGSPVVCDGDNEAVAGFVIADGCAETAGRVQLLYHSVNEFREWILDILSDETNERNQARFVANVIEFTSPEDKTGFFRCSATVFTTRHVLTTANCASIPASSNIKIQTRAPNATMVLVDVSMIFIHPNYNSSNPRSANLAVIHTSTDFHSELITPRSLGKLPTNSTCNVFGWSADIFSPSRVTVDVFAPEFCDPDSTEAYCSILGSNADAACSARPGSPVLCDDLLHVSGFVINEGACSTTGGRVMLNFHSVSEHQNWIEYVSGADAAAKMSVFVLLSGLLVSMKLK